MVAADPAMTDDECDGTAAADPVITDDRRYGRASIVLSRQLLRCYEIKFPY